MSGRLCCQTVQGGARESQVQGGPTTGVLSLLGLSACLPRAGGGGRGEMMKPPVQLDSAALLTRGHWT